MERKFLVDARRVEFVGAWLAHTSLPDAAYPVGVVSSCYYDNPNFDSYFASQDGDLDKTKVRLRWYGILPESGGVDAYLEVKEKDGFETWKRRLPVSVDAGALKGQDIAAALAPTRLKDALAELGFFEGSGLEPAVIISYARRRYREPFSGTSLSLDTKITARLATPGSSRQRRPLGTNVLELKGVELALPPRLKSVARFAPIWTSHSKYALAIEEFAGTGELAV